ncbi:anti-sigma-F factor NrsF [Caulobacter sp. 1776]|uniref:anti-sigma-F factor NrsF n=1 Tax=Caulobacter sp. 1776 TaxID=3156420 RepID=UPI003390851C
MRTDDLIDALASDAQASRGRLSLLQRLAMVAGLGALAALGMLLAMLHTRPDLGEAVLGGMFWMKAAYTALLGVAGYMAVERLARPAAGVGRRGWILGGVVLGLFALVGAIQAMMSPDIQMALHMLRGHSWRTCSPRILMLSLPMLALGLWVVRGMAPTRPTLAGLAMGLFSGGVAATVYGLHCPEHTFTFVALWYSLGVLGTAALGALIGRWALRW